MTLSLSHTARKHKLKQRLFDQQGWLNDDGELEVECAFGCGDLLVYATATLDRYPIMGQHGGRYEWGNVRLACRPCNSMNRNKNDPTQKTRKQKVTEKKQRKQRNKALRRLVEIRQDTEGSVSVNGIIKMDLR